MESKFCATYHGGDFVLGLQSIRVYLQVVRTPRRENAR